MSQSGSAVIRILPSSLLSLALWSTPWLCSLVHPYSPMVIATSPQQRQTAAIALAVALAVAGWAAATGALAAWLGGADEPGAWVCGPLAVLLSSMLLLPLRQEFPLALSLAFASVLGVGGALAVGLVCRGGSSIRSLPVMGAALGLAGCAWEIVLVTAVGLDALDQRVPILVCTALGAVLLLGFAMPAEERPVIPGPLHARLGSLGMILVWALPLFGVVTVGVVDVRPAPSPARAATGPNVVMIVVDTLRADHTTLAGYSLDTTPFMSELASSRATAFTAASAPATATAPSIKGVFSAQAPSHWGFSRVKEPPPSDAWTLPQAFQRAGYRTAAFSLNGQLDGFRTGFDQFWCAGGWAYYRSSPLLHGLLDGGSGWAGLQRVADWRLHTQQGQVARGLARAWLQDGAEAPFFLYLHTVDPHWPYYEHGFGLASTEETPDEPLSHVDLLRLQHGDRRIRVLPEMAALRELIGRYDEEVRFSDDVLRAVVSDLEALGVDDSTLIVLLGDHGEEFFEHDGFSHGHDVYEEQVHVPLLVRWPRGAAFESMPSRVEAPVSLIDTFATLVDYAELGPQPTPVPGHSWRSLLQGGEDAAHQPVVAESYSGGRLHSAYREGSLKVRVAYDAVTSPARSDDLTIFDLRADPRELDPIVPGPQYAGLLARARTALDARWRAARRAEGAHVGRASQPFDDALERLRVLGYVD